MNAIHYGHDAQIALIAWGIFTGVVLLLNLNTWIKNHATPPRYRRNSRQHWGKTTWKK